MSHALIRCILCILCIKTRKNALWFYGCNCIASSGVKISRFLDPWRCDR